LIQDLKGIKGLIFPINKQELFLTPRRELIKNIDNIPIPDFKFLNRIYFKKMEILATASVGKRLNLISSRGCPYKCLFCSTSHFWGKIRFHSAEYTAKMIRKAIDELGVDSVGFLDDLFAVNYERLNLFKNIFKKYGIFDHIQSIDCTQRTNLMTDRICEAINELKITALNFGFESGSDKILREIKCNSTSVDRNKNAILLCKKHGIGAFGSLMYGVPNETIEDMEKTNDFIDFAIEHRAKYIWSFVATPFPATPFWEIALHRGKVNNKMDWNLLSHHNVENPLLLDEGIDREEFKKVFLAGRKKLRKMKTGLIREFVFKNPIDTLSLLTRNPAYYFNRVIKKVYKQ
jgi:anaerobic magnesium-protoporphyrin IX monomethyl ester cyclase